MLNITESLKNLSGGNSNVTLEYDRENRIDLKEMANTTDRMKLTTFGNWVNRTNLLGDNNTAEGYGNLTNLEDWRNHTSPDDWDNRTQIHDMDNTAELAIQNTVFFILAMFSYAIMTIGIPGNLLVIVSILSNKFLRTAPNILVLSLSVCDFSFLSIIVPFHAHTLRVRQWDSYPELCWIVGLISNCLIGSSVLNIGSIAFNRYVAVVLSQKYRYLSRTRTLGCTLVFVYFVPLILVVPTFTGQFKHGTFGFDSREMMCGTVGGRILETIFVFTVLILPLILMTFCYVHILVHILVTRRRVKELGKDSTPGQNRTTMMLATVYAVYLLTTLPAVIINMLARSGMILPAYVDSIDFVIVWISSAMNPLVYGMVNKKYREAYSNVMKKLTIWSSEPK